MGKITRYKVNIYRKRLRAKIKQRYKVNTIYYKMAIEVKNI